MLRRISLDAPGISGGSREFVAMGAYPPRLLFRPGLALARARAATPCGGSWLLGA